MDRAELQAVQKPLKDRYREEPAAALITLRADGKLDDEKIACKVDTGRALVEAGLHPATGGSLKISQPGDSGSSTKSHPSASRSTARSASASGV